MPAFLVPLVAWLFTLLRTLALVGGSFIFRMRSYLLVAVAFLFATGLVPTIIRTLLGLGIGYVTYELSSFALDNIFQQLVTSTLDFPQELLAYMSLAQIDTAISILFGAISARLVLRSFNSDTLRSVRIFNNQ